MEERETILKKCQTYEELVSLTSIYSALDDYVIHFPAISRDTGTTPSLSPGRLIEVGISYQRLSSSLVIVVRSLLVDPPGLGKDWLS